MSESLILEEQDKISQDPTTHGSMLVPIILGSDKTTMSVTMSTICYMSQLALSTTIFAEHIVGHLP